MSHPLLVVLPFLCVGEALPAGLASTQQDKLRSIIGKVVGADNKPVAALFVVTARDGFSGPIKLLIGVSASGNITGVSVLEHKETPGLGDLIEASKSDWLLQFPRASIDFPQREQWAIKRDGGVFDQLTGASITPRAIIKAIKETLLYFEASREQVFAQSVPADSTEAEQTQ